MVSTRGKIPPKGLKNILQIFVIINKRTKQIPCFFAILFNNKALSFCVQHFKSQEKTEIYMLASNIKTLL